MAAAAPDASASPAAVLARNQLSSLLAQAFPEDLAAGRDSRRRFLAQLPAVRAALARHNVLGRVRDGKALGKFHGKLLQLIDAPELQVAGWELALVAVSQSAVEALEALAPALQSRAVRSTKVLASTKQEASDQDALAFAVACRVCSVLLRAVDRFAPEVRRDLLDALAKQLAPALLSFLLSALEQPETSDAVEDASTEALKLLTAALEAAPSSMRSHATKIENASVAALFRRDVSGAIALSVGINADSNKPKVSPLTRAATECLSKLPAASDKPLQAWTQLVQKAVEALHAQLDLLAGKRSTTTAASASSVPTNLKIWMRYASSSAVDIDLSALERGDACALLFSRAAEALATVMTSRIVSEREVQAVLIDIIAVARRALATRAHEVGKHTGVSEDGKRLPVSVVYGVLPIVHASALQVLSSVVSRAGICSLRYAGRITRTLLLAVENLRLEAGASYNAGGSTLGSSSSRALYDAVAVCVTTMGASTVERLGSPILTELVAQCQTQLADPVAPSSNAQAAANNGAGGDKKGKKRKRQLASGVPDVSQLNAALATNVYVSEYDRRERSANAHAALAAVATCVAVYGSLLPESERRAASEVAIVAANNANKSTSVNGTAANAVTLAMLTDAMTCDAASAHGGNLLNGMETWQQLVTRCTRNVDGAFGASEGSSSVGVALSVLLPLAALNAGEALLHPRAPPFVVNVASRDEEASGMHQLQKRLDGTSSSSVFPSSRRGAQSTPVRGDADDWHEAESAVAKKVEESDESEETKNDEKAPVAVVDEEEDEEEQEEEDYEDERPAKKANTSTADDAVEVEDNQRASSDEDVQGNDKEEDKAASDSGVKTSKAKEEEDDDDDEFPDIVMDDEDDE